jgi:hypothetical protein
MYIHNHTVRSSCAGALGVILAALLFQWAYVPSPPEFELSPVSGRATCGGHPLAGMWVVFVPANSNGLSAGGKVQADGSFRVEPWAPLGADGVPTGTYRVFFYGHAQAGLEAALDPKFRAQWTTDLRVHVAPDWNEFAFVFPKASPGRDQAQHL